MTKNYLTVLIASFFIAGFIFLALPDDGWAQPELGCCQNDNSGNCIAGTQTEEQCTTLPSRTWFPNDPPCPGGNTACESAQPTGCCQGPSTGQCEEDVTQSTCEDQSGQWFEGNVPCDAAGTCGDAEGCCSNTDGSCSIGVIEADCQDTGDSWSEGELCNILNTCGPAGCCQFDEPETACRPTNFDDCDDAGGVWTNGDICTVSGLCESNIIGCCVFGKNDCSEISELQCGLEDGHFEGAGVECSEVPICNIVVSPIPTLNQWGLIAMAGLLGFFSLFIIIRRHRYNIS